MFYNNFNKKSNRKAMASLAAVAVGAVLLPQAADLQAATWNWSIAGGTAPTYGTFETNAAGKVDGLTFTASGHDPMGAYTAYPHVVTGATPTNIPGGPEAWVIMDELYLDLSGSPTVIYDSRLIGTLWVYAYGEHGHGWTFESGNTKHYFEGGSYISKDGNGAVFSATLVEVPVPEPGTYMTLAGTLGLAFVRRRKGAVAEPTTSDST